MKIGKPTLALPSGIGKNQSIHKPIYEIASQLKDGQFLPISFTDRKDFVRVFSALRQASYRGVIGRVTQRGMTIYVAAKNGKSK